MPYKVGEVSYDYDSSKNQRIKQKFVGNEVHTCISGIAEYILSKSFEDNDAPFSYDDVENFYEPVCPSCDCTDCFEQVDFLYICESCEAFYDTKPDKCSCACADDDETNCDDCTQCAGYSFDEIEDAFKCAHCSHIRKDLSELDTTQQEVYEWWIVSGFLRSKLQALAHPVIPHENIWGRCTTGQAILLDGVISRICHDMQILEGQEHEWKGEWL